MKSYLNIFFHLLFATLYATSSCIRILIIAPGWSSSHVMFNYRLSKMLIDHGHHNVTLLIPQTTAALTDSSSAPVGVEEIRVPIVSATGDDDTMLSAFHETILQKRDPLSSYFAISQSAGDSFTRTINGVLNDYELFDRLAARKFDVLLSHAFFLWPVGLGDRLGVKATALVTPGAFLMDGANFVSSMPSIPSVSPNVLLPYSDRMTFAERLRNSIVWIYAAYRVHLPASLGGAGEETLFRNTTHPNTDNDPSLWTLAQNAKAIFINGRMELDFSRPLLPGTFYLGELEEKKLRPLTEEWRDYMEDRSKRGVIIFSLGTIFNTTYMQMRLKEAFFEAFQKFPDYSILWRLEGAMPVGLENHPHIKIIKWMPQHDLLHHRKTKLFITHGGYNSILEACNAGVPIALMPLFADQYANGKKAELSGVGLMLDRFTATGAQIERTIRSILTNESFSRKMKSLSSILNDHIADNQKVTVRRIEKLASGNRLWPSMKAAQRLNWIQYACLDVIAFYIALITLIAFSALALVRKIYQIVKYKA